MNDIVKTFTSSSSSVSIGTQIFGSLIDTQATFESYPYLKVEIIPSRTISVSGSNHQSSFSSFYADCQYYTIPFSGFAVYELSHNSSTCRHGYIPSWTSSVNFSTALSSDETLIFTLTTDPFDSPSVPSGSITLTENGTFDVTNYASAIVDVPPEVIQGDYHNDLVNIYNAIILCAGVCMVLYFFYSIYRFLIKSTGGWR